MHCRLGAAAGQAFLGLRHSYSVPPAPRRPVPEAAPFPVWHAFLQPRRLEGQVAVVCGTGNAPEEGWGIGTTTAVEMARQGAQVVCVSRTAEKLEALRRVIEAEGGRCLPVPGDMTNPEDVQRLVMATISHFGRVDTVVNAGIFCSKYNGMNKLTFSKWSESIGKNLHAQFLLLHHFVPHMVEQQTGNFIFVSTIATQTALGMGKQRVSYSAGKAGSEVLTKQVGIEYARQGIRGNVVRVGYVDSPLVARAALSAGVDPTALRKKRDAYCPSGRQGEPLDVAHAVVFLASREARYINGSDIVVDGGTSACTSG
eukprot:EG_transcript_9796